MTVGEINRSFARRLEQAPGLSGRAFVFGEGKASHPRLMLIGEAPGEREEAEGRPFAGKAGKILDGYLVVLKQRREDIYITNAVKTRPVRQGKSGRDVNRAPCGLELELFAPWLLEEISAVEPGHIVTLGNVPLRSLLGREASIGAMHGTWTRKGQGPPVFAMYHPAAVIYRRELLSVCEQDLQVLARTIDLH